MQQFSHGMFFPLTMLKSKVGTAMAKSLQNEGVRSLLNPQNI